MLSLSRGFVAVIVCSAWTAPVLAADWYVDAVNGSNANNGTSPGSAWLTITHALATVPQSGPQTIHVAPGTYDTALGETPVWSWRPELSLIGDQGSAVTTIVGIPGSAVISMASLQSMQGWTFNRDTRIEGLSFQGGYAALSLSSNWNPVSPTLRELAIRGMSDAGINVSTFTQFQGGAAQPLLDNIRVRNCAVGLDLSCAGTGVFTVTASDSSFSANSGDGLACLAFRSIALALDRCRIDGNTGWGVHYSGANYGNIQADLRRCTIAHNAGGGVWGSAGSLYFSTVSRLTQCTVAYNTGIGVRMDRIAPIASLAHLNSTIVHGNSDDLQLASPASSVKYCEIGNGEYTGSNGNFQADPQFVNAAAGDFHLLATSPCIDSGDPALGLETDCSRPDVGAFPFAQVQSQVYCTAKLNSCGSLPSIGGTGTPSASSSSGYVVSANQTKGLKAGLLMYSITGRAASPFLGGTLCVAAPVKRSTPVVDTVGTNAQCNGVLSIDMNAFAAGALGGNPLGALNEPGTRVDCQFWGRDTPASSLLSDALEYFVCL